MAAVGARSTVDAVATARLVLALDDLARLMAGGLGARAQAVAVRVHPDDRRALLVRVEGLLVAQWLPRVTADVRIDLHLVPAAHRLALRYHVHFGRLSSLLLVPGQHLGGGRRVADALVAALALDDAVVARSDTGLRLDLDRALRRLPLPLSLVAIEPRGDGLHCRLALDRDRRGSAAPRPGGATAGDAAGAPAAARQPVGMSRLELDADALTRLLAGIGVRAAPSADGLALAGAGWSAVLAQADVVGRVRIGPIAARIGRVALRDGGAVIEFSIDSATAD